MTAVGTAHVVTHETLPRKRRVAGDDEKGVMQVRLATRLPPKGWDSAAQARLTLR